MKWPTAKACAKAHAACGRWAWVVPCPAAHGGYTVLHGAGPLYRPVGVAVLVEVPPPAKTHPRPVLRPHTVPKARTWMQGLLL